MNIIICGAGRVVIQLQNFFRARSFNTVIDQSSDDIQKINDDLDVKSIVRKNISNCTRKS